MGDGRAADAHPVLPGMPTKLYPCTPTRLTTWTDCPRRYRMTYLDRPKPPPGPRWAHNSVGTAVHQALADWWTLPLARRVPAAAAALLRKAWVPAGFRDADQAQEWQDRSATAVATYTAGVDPTAEPVGTERTVSTPTASLVLSGRVDRLDRRDGALVVVDYKTGRRVPDDDDARTSLALGIYAVAASRTMRAPCHRVELHHVPTGTVAVAEHDAESLRRKVAEAESIAADSSRADAAFRAGGGEDLFPARTGPLCSWCDLRPHCPEGLAASTARQPWDALAE